MQVATDHSSFWLPTRKSRKYVVHNLIARRGFSTAKRQVYQIEDDALLVVVGSFALGFCQLEWRYVARVSLDCLCDGPCWFSCVKRRWHISVELSIQTTNIPLTRMIVQMEVMDESWQHWKWKLEFAKAFSYSAREFKLLLYGWTLSLPRVINFKFPLQPRQKYYIT